MQNFRLKLSLFLNYFVFAILLNSVGTVILQVQANYDITKGAASILEAFKDISIAATSFLVASFIVRIGYKKAMLIALAVVTVVCLVIPSMGSFAMTKLLFAAAGFGFALTKVSVFASLGLVTNNQQEHLSLMNFLESFFMIGILCGYFLFAYFVDDKNPKSSSWLSAYYVIAGLSALAFLLLLTAPFDESKVKSAERESAASLEDNFTDMMRLIILPLVLVFICCIFFYVLIEQSIMSWLPTFNSDVLHLSKKTSIQMASILTGALALGRFLAGIIFKKINWLYVLWGCLLLAGSIVLVTVPMAKNITGKEINNLSDIPLVAFAFSWPRLLALEALVVPVLGGGLVWWHASTVWPRARRWLGGAVVSLLVLGLGLQAAGRWEQQHLFGPPYLASLAPPAFRLASPKPPASLIDSLRPLQAELARQANKDNEAPEADPND